MDNLKALDNSWLKFFKIAFFGFIIGIAAIIPGLSGGILAISLGVYAPAINSIINLPKKFKESVSFLLPLGIGAVLGVFVFGVIMKPLLENYERNVIWFFIGLILGSSPSLIKESTKKGFRITYIIPMIIAFSIGMYLTKSLEQNMYTEVLSPLHMMIGGGVLALGVIVPGVSSSFILMQMGIYDKIISAFVSFDLYFVFFVGLGGLICFILTIQLINIAFKKLYGYAYFTAFGFLLSTVVAVYPGVSSTFDILLCVIGMLLVYLFMEKTTV